MWIAVTEKYKYISQRVLDACDRMGTEPPKPTIKYRRRLLRLGEIFSVEEIGERACQITFYDDEKIIVVGDFESLTHTIEEAEEREAESKSVEITPNEVPEDNDEISEDDDD